MPDSAPVISSLQQANMSACRRQARGGSTGDFDWHGTGDRPLLSPSCHGHGRLMAWHRCDQHVHLAVFGDEMLGTQVGILSSRCSGIWEWGIPALAPPHVIIRTSPTGPAPHSSLAYAVPVFRPWAGGCKAPCAYERGKKFSDGRSLCRARQELRMVTNLWGRFCKGLGTGQRTTMHKGFCGPEA